jgi:hypothetical protein
MAILSLVLTNENVLGILERNATWAGTFGLAYSAIKPSS